MLSRRNVLERKHDKNRTLFRSARASVALVVAIAFALAVSTGTVFALTGSMGGPSAPSAPAASFASGSLIIPMDTDTSGNHAAYNQNLGMWKAYGLLYKLLQNGIPVRWAIVETKSSTADVDFTVNSVKDKRTNTSLSAWDYRGGSFIVDSADVAAALPIITAWWAAKGNLPNVHEALTSFSADVNIVLRSAPRIANEAINGGISIAYYNAAGIPDLNGNPWSTTSPNILDQSEIAAGGLFNQGSVCLQRKFDVFVTPHNSGYAYSLSDPTNLGTKTYSQLDTFVHEGGGWTALCHSILSNENAIAALTKNGSAAVKNMFKTSLAGGVPGGFLTTQGFTSIDNTGGSWTVPNAAADLPVAQLVGTAVPQALPGGSVQTWPSPGNPGAPTYYGSTERVGFFDTLGVDHDNIIAGTYHNGTGLGKLTYIGGHSFSTAVPYSGNFEAPYLRAFYNSLFFNGSAVAKLDLKLSPSTFPQNGTGTLSASIVNTGASLATNVTNASVTLSPGFTYVGTTSGPAPTVSGQTLTWASLGNLTGGQTAVTIEVSVGAGVSSTAGAKQFGTFNAAYGDIFGEGFTAEVCRDVTISPVPAPALTKTPSTQGPVSAGSAVGWTLTYGNTGATQLQNAILQDTLPPGFSYTSSSSSPSLGAPTVIPSLSGTIVRWNVGTIAANTPAAGTVTITARAGAVTSGTGDPLQQTFTNEATLKGKDAGGNEYSANASADVVVRALSLTLGKSVNNTFIASPPGGVTYTLTPGSTSNDLLDNVRVIDPVPTGVTSPVAGQGGTVGAYAPIAAVPGVDGNYLTAMTVGSNFVTQGSSVNVTLNVKFNASVPGVSPSDLTVSGGSATCTGPTPASGTVPNGGAGLNFVWVCTLNDLGEYVFSADASDGVTNDWPEASSASVLSAAGGGPNVVTWNLGSNTAAVPGQTVTSGYTAGIYGFRGATTNTFQKYDLTSSAWEAKTNALDTIAKGGALTTDGAGTIYGLRGNTTQTFYAYDIATNAWTNKANTGTAVGEGGALVFLNVSGTKYVFATMGNGTGFRRYDVAANTWAAMANTPANVKKGGALTTDGTNIYALRGDRQKTFWRYNVGANTWTAMAPLVANIGWGGSLTRIGGFIYALRGDGQKNFYRYDIGANTWSAMASTPANVGDGGALTNDGTSIYAFQGKTTTFWRYNVAANTWTALAPFTAATNQGGALVYSPGVNPQGRFSSLSASRSLVVTGNTVKVTFALTASTAINDVAPSTLTVTPTSGASCSSLSGPTLTSANDDISGTGDPVTYEWTCTVLAGTSPGSLKFSNSATGSGPTTFPAATSNSVIVSPLLTFSAIVPIGAPNPVVDTALMIANGETTSSPQVSTFSGSPILTIVKSNSPPESTTLLPGDPITYSMLVENSGSGNATGVVVTDSVPTNTGYVSCSGGMTCSQTAGTVTWTVGPLAPGETATISFTVSTSTTLPISATPYAITNNATVDSDQTTPVVSNTVTNHLQVKPTIIKSVSLAEAGPGDTLTYTLDVSNPGATFTADVTDVVPAGATFSGTGTCVPACTFAAGTVTWSGATIASGATTSFSFDVTVTGGGGTTVTNSGSLDPSSPNLDPIPSNPVETKIGPELEIVKLNSPTGEVVAGNIITYTLLVSNESDVTATSVVVTDPVPVGTSYVTCTTPALTTCGESAGVVTWNLGSLAGGESVLVTFDVTVGTPPVGTLQIANQAQVTAANSPDPVLSNVVYNALPFPALVLTKTASPMTYDSVGDVISYSYVVTNNSTTSTLAGPVTVTDDKAIVTCPAGGLAPLASKTCTASYTIVQADLDNGSVTNTARAHANGTDSNFDEETVTAEQNPALSIVKTATPSTYDQVGDVIGYSFKVTNSGNVTLPGPFSVSDDRSTDEACPATASLAPGAFITCTASYAVTQGDLDFGSVTNVASATNGTVTSPTDTETVTAVQTKSMTVAKTSTTTSLSAPATVSYSYLVTNTGNVTLTGISLSDDNDNNDLSCPFTFLAPTASMTCTATHTFTQAELDANGSPVAGSGELANAVTATSTEAPNAVDTLEIPIVQSSSLTIDKSASPLTYDEVGDSIAYSYKVTNSGNTTLFGPFSVADDKVFVVCPPTGALAPGAFITCTTSYSATQADLDAGSITNIASATNGTVTSNTDTETVTAVQSPALSLDKSASPTSYDSVGDLIEYSYLLTNEGNVTLDAPFTVTDDKLSVSCPALPSSLAPDASVTCTASYLIQQADLDNGSIVNTATGHVEYQNATVDSNTDEQTVTAVQSPALSLDKSASPTSYDSVGDLIEYSYLLTNEGNVTLDAPFTVTDDKLSVSCPALPSSLAPDASVTCTASYLIQQADLDNGSIVNTATGHVEYQNATVDSNTDEQTVTAVQSPALSLDKSASPTSYDSVGDLIEYSYLLTNEGNVTLDAPFTVTDDKLSVSCPALPSSLAPDASVTCTASYLIQQADLDNGSIVNTATGHVEYQNATVDSNTDEQTVTAVQSPALSLDKSASPTSYDSVGDLIEYSYLLTNEGNVTLDAPFTVTDDKLSVSCPALPSSLAPDASVTCTASYLIQQADLDNGSIVNTATGHVEYQNATVDSNTDEQTVTAVQSPALSLDKSASPTSYDSVGDLIEYSYLLTNEGNVTLDAPFTVTDDKLSVSCPALPSSLAPDASVTCTASYLIQQADLDNGSIVNTATGHVEYQNATVDSNTDEQTVTAVQSPALSLDKSASPTSYDSVGDLIEYSYLLTNEGNVTLDAPFTVTDDKLSVSCPALPSSLAPDASVTCTASYLIQQADLDNGSIVNTATGHVEYQNATVDSNTDEQTVTAVQSPALSLDKSASPTSYDSVGDLIEYSYLLTNTGNVTLDAPFTVTDDKLSVSCPALPSSLAPDASVTCTASYLIQQADLDNGSIVNTATGHVEYQNATVDSNTDEQTVTAVQSPALSLDKSASPTSYDSVGDLIEYSYLLTNTGNVTLDAPFTVTDDKLSVSCPALPSSLAPDASVTCTASYLIQQADLDNGSIVNTATGHVEYQNATVDSNTDEQTVTAVQSPALSLDKSASPTSYDSVGDLIEYSYLLTNTGNVTLDAPFTVTDDKLSVSCPALPSSLAPDASVTCTASYLIQQADLDNGSIVNTATGHVEYQNATVDSNTDEQTVTAVQSPALSLDKSASPTSYDSVGDLIEYSYLLTNEGNVTLDAPFTVTDDKLSVSCPALPSSLAPDASVTCTASYLIQQADLDNGSIVNTATGHVEYQNATVDSNTDEQTVTAVQSPALSLDKSASPTSYDSVGDLIEYSYLLTNTGNVTLDAPFTVTDDKLSVSCPALPSSLAPDASVTCTASYLIQQADLDNGSIVNTATGHVEYQNATVDSNTDEQTVTAVQSPALSLDKSASPTSYDSVGDLIEYSYLLTNTGNVTLDAPFTVTDDKLSVSCPALPSSLAPDASVTCTASYLIQQADLDNGSIVNTATGHVEYQNATVDSNTDEQTVTAVQSPALSLDKSASPTSYDSVGDLIEYSYLLTNEGNVTLDAPFTVTDDKLSVSCPALPSSLAPDASVTCTASYLIQQADLDNGSIVNTATGHVEYQNATVDSNTDEQTVTAVQSPALSLDKSASPTSYDSVGDLIEYSYLLTNTGNVTLDAPFTVTDDKLSVSCPALPSSLAPDASVTCTASYLIQQADLDNGSIVNTATGHVEYQNATVDSNTDEQTVTAVQSPALSLDKSASPTSYDSVGDLIEYSYLLTNEGNVTLDAPFTVTDDKLSVSCPALPSSLAPDASVTCTASYLIQQADLDNGSIVNTATGHVEYQNATVDSNTDEQTVTAVQSPALSLDKSASPTSYDSVGDLIEYSYLLTNTGNVTLDAPFTVTDDKLSVSCPALPSSLAPDASVTCTASYLIQQADLDNGSIVNTATGHVEYQNATVDSNTDEQTVTAVQSPALSLDKSASPTSYDSVGDLIEYSYLLTNTGNVTLDAPFTVTDDKLSVSCPALPSSLAPDASVTCTASYLIQQADLDNGSIVNTATGHVEYQNATVDSNTDEQTVTAVQSPALSLAKDGLLDMAVVPPSDRADAGDKVDYTLTATNTGNVTLSGITVVDPKLGTLVCTPAQPASLAPGASIVCMGTYTLTQADVNNGSVTNTATADSDQTTPTEATETVPLGASASMTVEKSSTTSSLSAPATVDYSYLVTNTGNVTLTGIGLVDDNDNNDVSCPFTSLAPAASMTCSATHSFTQAELDANGSPVAGSGVLANTVTASSNEAPDVLDSLEIPITRGSSLAIEKSASPLTYDEVGDSIGYSYKVTNTGNTTLFGPFSVADDKASALCPLTGALAPDAFITCTASYSISQADLDAGSVTNVASATNGTVTSATDTETVTALQSPALSLAKDGLLVTTVVPPNGRADAGDRVDYTLTATNTGNVTLSGVTVSDPKLGTLVCTPTQPASLLPGGQIVCTGSYTLTLADINNGSVSNTATADSGQTDPTEATETVPLTASPALSLVKKTNGTDNDAAPGPSVASGSTVTWSYEVTNTGNVSLTGVNVTDDQEGAICTIGTLAPGASQTCTETGVATSGQYSNLGTATGTPPAGADVTATNPDHYFGSALAPGMTIEKTADPTTTAPYQPVTYTYVVTNTGGTVLTNVKVTDDNGTPTFPGDDFTVGTIATLNPGDSATLTATVIPVVSTVGVVNGSTVPAGSVIVVVPQANGDIKVTYRQDFGVNDNTYGTGAIGWPSGHTFGDLTGSDKLEFRFFDANGNRVLDFYQDTISASTAFPSGYGSLCASGGDGFMVSGNVTDIVSCTTSIADNLNNPGNVPKKASLIVNSPTSLVSGNVVVDPVKAPGGWDSINSYTVVIKASAFGAAGFGSVAVPDQHNSPNKRGGAHGMVTTPVDSTVINTATATAGTLTATDTATISIVVPPSSLSGFVYVDTDNDGVKEVGEGPIANVTVKLTGTTATGTAVSLTTTTNGSGLYTFPNLSAGTYTITETQPAGYPDGKDTIGTPGGTVGSDVFSNIALNAGVNGVNNNFGERPVPVATVNVVKSSTTTSITAAGQVVPYTFTVTNTGNVLLTSIKVTDAKCTTSVTRTGGDTNGDNKLQMTETWVYACNHTVTQAEIAAGGYLTNTVTADSNESAPDTDTVNIPITGSPALSIVKKTNGTDNNVAPGPTVLVGTTVSWSYLVTNTGNVSLTGVNVTDDKEGAICTIGTLAPGASATCTKTGVAVAGQYTNVGTATGTPPVGANVSATNADNYLGSNVAPNHAPVAVNDTGYKTKKNTPLTIAAPGVLANDTDADGNSLTAVLVTNVSQGTLVLNPNGSFTYTPANNFTGNVTFTYKANDGIADSNVATVTIQVTK